METPTDRRTPVPFPTHGPKHGSMAGASWHDYFKGLRLAREEGANDTPPVVRTVKRVSMPPVAAHAFLGRSIRQLIKRLSDANWPLVSVQWSLVEVSDEFRAADSKKKPGQEAPEHRKGEILRPAHEVRNWWLHAAHPDCWLGFRAHWTEGVTPKGARSFGFQSALAMDPVGMPTELFVDYSVSADQAKRVADEPGHIYESRLALLEAAARRRDREYNDGHSWLNRHPRFTSFKEFGLWLDEAIDMTTPKEVADAA